MKNLIKPVVGKYLGTVKRGAYKAAQDLLQDLKSNGVKIGRGAYHALSNVSLSQTEEEVDLWEVTPADLGIIRDYSLIYACAKAFKLGFDECLPEDGAMLQLICKDNTDYCIAALDLLEDYEGWYGVLHISSDKNDRNLSMRFSASNGKWRYICIPWVFVWPRREYTENIKGEKIEIQEG